MPGLEWTILCYLDLETRGRAVTGEEIERVVDYKVKGSPISQPQADRDPQASLYLTGAGWRAGRPRSSPLRRSPNPADRESRSARY